MDQQQRQQQQATQEAAASQQAANTIGAATMPSLMAGQPAIPMAAISPQIIGLMTANPAVAAQAQLFPAAAAALMPGNPFITMAGSPSLVVPAMTTTSQPGTTMSSMATTTATSPFATMPSTTTTTPSVYNTTAILGEAPGASDSNTNTRNLTPSQRAQHHRDRNREHARSTRLRKKAYVQKLKDLVDGLHAERSEEARQRRVAIQHLAEVQQVRRRVVNTVLEYLSQYCEDHCKWRTVVEEDEFWLQQPITPYRSFRRAEIEKVSALTGCPISHVMNMKLILFLPSRPGMSCFTRFGSSHP